MTPFAGKPGDVWRIATLPTVAAEIVAHLEGEAIWDWGGGLIWLLCESGSRGRGGGGRRRAGACDADARRRWAGLSARSRRGGGTESRG